MNDLSVRTAVASRINLLKINGYIALTECWSFLSGFTLNPIKFETVHFSVSYTLSELHDVRTIRDDVIKSIKC